MCASDFQLNKPCLLILKQCSRAVIVPSEELNSVPGNNTNKRKVHSRLNDVEKKVRLQSHELGKDCCRTRLTCVSEVTT